MKHLLSILLATFIPALAHAGNHGCRVAAVPYVQNHAVAVKQVFVAQPYYFAVGVNTQFEAQVARQLQPVLDELKQLRSEQAEFRAEQKAGFSQLSAKFNFRGQGTFTVEGAGGGDTPVVPVDPVPHRDDPPAADAAPPLTPEVKQLFTAKCAKCHTGKDTGFDVDKPLTASDSSEILTRVLSADKAIQMPPANGSTEADRAAIVQWVFSSDLKASEQTIKQRKGQK